MDLVKLFYIILLPIQDMIQLDLIMKNFIIEIENPKNTDFLRIQLLKVINRLAKVWIDDENNKNQENIILKSIK